MEGTELARISTQPEELAFWNKRQGMAHRQKKGVLTADTHLVAVAIGND